MKILTLQRNMQSLMSGPTFLQYVATVPTLCYYFKFQKQKTLQKTICITGFFEQNFGPHCWMLLPNSPALLN